MYSDNPCLVLKGKNKREVRRCPASRFEKGMISLLLLHTFVNDIAESKYYEGNDDIAYLVAIF